MLYKTLQSITIVWQDFASYSKDAKTVVQLMISKVQYRTNNGDRLVNLQVDKNGFNPLRCL